MIVALNGEQRELPERATVAEALALIAIGADARGVAVAVDAEVVPRSAWETTALAAGARIEVLGAVQGG